MNFLAFVSVSVGLINPASIMYKADTRRYIRIIKMIDCIISFRIVQYNGLIGRLLIACFEQTSFLQSRG